MIKSEMCKKGKIWAIVLYVLPMVFFIVSYFLITTSGEDIVQGANTEPTIMQDAGEAFVNNGRLPDMYAWSVINFFDYQYEFGVDTIFRAIDVVLAVGILYIITVIVLGRKLRLEISDAMIFCVSFLMLMLTPHGRVMYAGFSAIHNYVLIGVISLGFLTPYLLATRGKKIPKGMIWSMLPLGILFGMSSSLTPVVFIIAIVIYGLIVKERPASWAVVGVVGTIVGILISQLLGPGVGNYAANEVYVTTYDYVAIRDLLNNFGGSAIKICWHLVSNFGRVLLPLMVLLCGGLLARKKQKIAWPEKKMMMFGGIFVVVHILIASQLDAPLRILLPAYLIGMILVLSVLLKNPMQKIIGILVGVLVVVVLVIRVAFAVQYHEKTAKVLERIRSSQDSVICVDREDIRSETLSFVYLGQEPMLVEWAMPQIVYGREIVFCDK